MDLRHEDEIMDASILDRMEYIAEEEEEDYDSNADAEEDDDDSLDPNSLFGVKEDDDEGDEDDNDYSDETEEGLVEADFVQRQKQQLQEPDSVAPLERSHWAPPPGHEGSDDSEEGSGLDFQISGMSKVHLSSSMAFEKSVSSDESGAPRPVRRISASRRRSSRISLGSERSVPSINSMESCEDSSFTIPLTGTGTSGRRSALTSGMASPTEEGTFPPGGRQALLASRRRKSVSLRSLSSTPNSTSSVQKDGDESTTSSVQSRFSRKSTRDRRSSFNTMSVGGQAVPNFDTLDSAVSSLGQSGNNEWQSLAAAAAVVAASNTEKTTKRSHIQFSVEDRVLVFLNILNHTNSTDNQDSFTIAPVNKYGYPPGEGKIADEQRGPYVYVLATVKKVHFDEDVRYYTVARADTGAHQRADTAWMEPIKASVAVESAMRASQQTSRSASTKQVSEPEDKPNCFTACISWPVKFLNNAAIPAFQMGKRALKRHIAMFLFGETPYACQIRATGINVLVLCSFVYVFLESITLAFIPADANFAASLVGAVVWSILAIELFLEWLIRPEDYFELIESDKAYAPSTSRNINSYHLFFELLSLVLFIPEFRCHFSNNCQNVPFSAIWASIHSVFGPTRAVSALGRFCIGLRSLRIFGLVRHWKKMWINNTFRDDSFMKSFLVSCLSRTPNDLDAIDTNDATYRHRFSRRRKAKVEDEGNAEYGQEKRKEKVSLEEDQRLKKAATIGTALMVVNSHRALFLLSLIVTFLPMILSLGGVNRAADNLTDLLQANNINALNCDHLALSLESWLRGSASVYLQSPTQKGGVFIIWAQVLPADSRCPWLPENGVITNCDIAPGSLQGNTACDQWDEYNPENPDDATTSYFADVLNVRVGSISEYERTYTGNVTGNYTDGSSVAIAKDGGETITFSVRVLFNHNDSITWTNFSSFLLLLSTILLSLIGLTVLRGDASRLVLHPLQRMLKIIVRYAKNPLSNTGLQKARVKRKSSQDGTDDDGSDNDKSGTDREQLGNYETEQLINAITKIADLLRKCWGVAGAGIISSNLARTEDGKTVVFNPTVPGKRVYALFGFVSIDGFSDQLRALDRDVMILINDVAKVVHDEVYRWALGDSGQCNKNLGNAFLMVFRIGDFKEVHEKQARATNVVFKGYSKKSPTIRNRGRKPGTRGNVRNKGLTKADGLRGADTLQLASLPGIQTFSDRALLGMLKSFAGIHRDKSLNNWKQDFRLGAGVGAYTVNIIIGMDAGWAVEGAVGSEYKIDATYLSPHVNMAARMMSASKQYGVTILLSQAVEELLSTQARAKLRHLDTVYVKGSSVSQRIFTYDARHQGVDFFLFERSPEQSDMDAEAYTPMIWENDQDLRSMRQHVTEEFVAKFQEGKDAYLAGDWPEAIEALLEADDMMITTVLEEGYLDYNPDEIDGRIFDRRNKTDEIMRIRSDLGDGACKQLVSFMQKRKGIPPDTWNGVRPLTSK